MNVVDRGESRIPERRIPPWGALAYRDFRLIWSGQIVSQLGTWMQFTSLTYLLAVVLSHGEAQSSLNLGFLGAAQSIPALLLAPIAGVVAERYPRRRTLLIVGSVRAVLALALAFVSQGTGTWVLALALFVASSFAAAQSFDFPTRQSWFSLIVPRKLLSNAVGLSAIAQNFPLMVGPALAGVLIGTVGVYASFYVNAVAQCAVIVAVLCMRPVPVSNVVREPMVRQIVTGFRFMAGHAVLGWAILALLSSSLFVRPYNLLLAGFAAHVLHVDAKIYGSMLAMGGIGTVVGALTTATWRSERRGRLWLVSGSAIPIGLLVVGYVHLFPVVLVCLTVMGWGAMTFTGATNVLIQTHAPGEMRGRALSLYAMMVQGVPAIGALLMGALAARIGLPAAYVAGGAIGLAVVLAVWLTRPAIRAA